MSARKLSSTSDIQQGPHSLPLVGMKVNKEGNLDQRVFLGTAVFYACSFLALPAPVCSGMGHGWNRQRGACCVLGRALVNLCGFCVGALTTQRLFEAAELVLLSDDVPG